MLVVIRPKKAFTWSDLTELWRFRELLYFFSWRDLKVRYKQTAIGVLWAFVQPVLAIVVFSIFFGRLAGMPSDGAPYPLFVSVGVILWQFFSGALTDVSNCLIAHQAILTKVYFPRLLLPISAVLTKLVDLSVAVLVLACVMAYYGRAPSVVGVLRILPMLGIAAMAALGMGLLFASLNVRFRDVRYALPFFIELLLFLTPVLYPQSIAGRHSWVLALNPMSGVIKTARASLLGTSACTGFELAASIALSIGLLLAGLYVFKKAERTLADVL